MREQGMDISSLPDHPGFADRDGAFGQHPHWTFIPTQMWITLSFPRSTVPVTGTVPWSGPCSRCQAQRGDRCALFDPAFRNAPARPVLSHSRLN